ncbi:hypothetical protein [Neobacillus terrae]|uniref:hypothetical protein n=1 Tax=Neobacillus terrae TaxID=3034837 RepID=UPI00140D7252|nr:hypothetical protein [Neobacillus terrae]NHM30174.1 hypothetical protein [Neobacillus terrae]
MKEKQETIKANEEIMDQLEDGETHTSFKGSTEAEHANTEMTDKFRSDKKQQAEGVSPAFVFNPSFDLNPEEE